MDANHLFPSTGVSYFSSPCCWILLPPFFSCYSLLQSKLSPSSPTLVSPPLKLNHFHFYTCVWWGNYRLLNRAWSFKTHTLSLSFTSSPLIVQPIVKLTPFPHATLLPSKSDPTITTNAMRTYTIGCVEDLSLSCQSLSPRLYPSIILFSLFSAETLSITHLPQHTTIDLLSVKRLASERASGR